MIGFSKSWHDCHAQTRSDKCSVTAYICKFTEETPVTENNEASEDVKNQQSELKETSSLENEGNAKEEEAPPAIVEASSEAPRGLGSFTHFMTWINIHWMFVSIIFLFHFRAIFLSSGLLANRRRLAIRRPGTI